jgi:hypothetical protein
MMKSIKPSVFQDVVNSNYPICAFVDAVPSLFIGGTCLIDCTACRVIWLIPEDNMVGSASLYGYDWRPILHTGLQIREIMGIYVKVSYCD